MTPLHIGGYGDSFDTDLPLARDGAGSFYVPGTSLAGPMRAWCLDAFGKGKTEAFWGYQEKDKGQASFVLIEDAAVLDFNDKPLRDYETEIRDGVGINRKWGVAEDQFKFDRTILPRDSKLDFQMTVDVGAGEDFNAVRLGIGHLLQALKDGDVPFGAAKTRGLGHVCLLEDEELQIRVQSRKGKDFLNHLGSGGTPSSISQLKGATTLHNQPARLTFEINWHPRGALMIKSGADGIGVDMLPLVSGRDGGLALVLSGSSIKGAMRSHAERIARTVLKKCLDSEEKFDEQLTHIRLMREMFGMGKPAASYQTQEDGRIGAVTVSDCYAKQSLTRKQWQTITRAKEKNLMKALDEVEVEWSEKNEKRRFESTQHVAIDRWTGGAAESMLFSTLEPFGIEWDPIMLTLDLAPRRHAKKDEDKKWKHQKAAVSLLLLTLRDLVAGRLPLGFAVNRGMGDVEVTRIHFRGRNLNSELSSLSHKTIELDDNPRFFSEFDTSLLKALNDDWKAWREETDA